MCVLLSVPRGYVDIDYVFSLVDTAVNEKEFTQDAGPKGFIFGEFLKTKYNWFKKDFTKVNKMYETQKIQ